MGVDRRLFVSNRWDVRDVSDAIESLFNTKVKYEPSTFPDYCRLNFKVGDEDRSMSVFHSERHGFSGLSLSLGASGCAEQVLRGLGERLGGFYNHEDCDDKWEGYSYTAGENLEFLLKDAIKTGASDGRDIDELIVYLKKHQKEARIQEEKRQQEFNELLSRRRK